MKGISYKEAEMRLTGRCYNSRKIANHTYLIRDEEYLAVKYHETEIIKLYADNTSVISTNGWLTVSTKDRLNTYSEVYIFSKKGVWYVQHPYKKDQYYEFFDGMIVQYGQVLNAEVMSKEKEKERNHLQRAIDLYAKKMATLALKGKLGAVSSGDCWYCLLKTEENITIGDHSNSHKHLIDHVREGYYVPSLFWNAMNEARDRMSSMDKIYVGELSKNVPAKDIMNDNFHYISIRLIGYIRSYMYKRLGFQY